MTFRLGLTGSIGMGKSTTAQMFRDMGHPIWDADQAVHRLYARGGAGVEPVSDLFPSALHDDGIDRDALKLALRDNPDGLTQLEKVVHPLVAEDRQHFLQRHQDAPLVVLDIPLLFESQAAPEVDGVAVASTDAATQAARVLARRGMTPETLRLILARQMPDVEKRARADWIIPTHSLEAAREAVNRIIREVVPDA